MFSKWTPSYMATPHPKPYYCACIPPDGNLPPPFIRGVLSRGSRRLYTTAIQLATGHSFSADYSVCFRPHAGDNTLCPCSTPGNDVPHSTSHILYRCPLFTTMRNATLGLTPSYHQFK